MAQKVAQLINTIPDPNTRSALQLMWETLRKDLASNKTKFDGHTHRADGSNASVYNTSRPQSDTEGETQVTAETFDQNFEA